MHEERRGLRDFLAFTAGGLIVVVFVYAALLAYTALFADLGDMDSLHTVLRITLVITIVTIGVLVLLGSNVFTIAGPDEMPEGGAEFRFSAGLSEAEPKAAPQAEAGAPRAEEPETPAAPAGEAPTVPAAESLETAEARPTTRRSRTPASCGNCGGRLPQRARFCPHCGTSAGR